MRRLFSTIPVERGDGCHMSDRETIKEASLTHLQVPTVDSTIVHANKDEEGIPRAGRENDAANGGWVVDAHNRGLDIAKVLERE